MRQVNKRKRQEDVNLEFVDIRALLDHINVPYYESGKNVSTGWIGVNCPMPDCDDPSNHMGINLKSPVCTCYKCGKKGNYLTYLAAEVGNWGKAIELIKKFTPIELKMYQDPIEENNISYVNLPEEADKNPSKYQINYLKNRGFDPKELDILCDLYYCSPIGDWANRIIVPIYKRNKLVTFTSVDIAKDSKLRYKHLSKEKSIIHTKNNLYGIEQCTGRNIIVVEGFFDKLRIGAGCVCTFGTKVTPEQKRLLTKFSKVIVLFDGDKAGWINGRKLAVDISAFTEVELITLNEGIDPDDLSKEEIKQLQNIVKTRW